MKQITTFHRPPYSAARFFHKGEDYLAYLGYFKTSAPQTYRLCTTMLGVGIFAP